MYKIFQQHGTVITDVGPPYQTSGENGRARLRRNRFAVMESVAVPAGAQWNIDDSEEDTV